MNVHLHGDRVTCDAVRSQLDGAGATVLDEPAGADLEIIASADPAAIRRTNQSAIEDGRPLLVIELGGVGGRAVAAVDGALTRVLPTGPCYGCLQRRVEAAGEAASDALDEPADSVKRLLGSVAGWIATDRRRNPKDPGTAVIEFPWSERSLLPVPGCPVCSTDAQSRWTTETAGDARSVEAAVEVAEHAIDERLGIIATIGEAQSIPLPYYLATLTETAGFSDVSAPSQAAGVDTEWNRALMRAVGEGLERYAAGVYRADDFRVGTADEFDRAVDLDTVVRPDDRASVASQLPWVRGRSLQDDSDIWIPAELVVFPPPDRRIRPAITTGLAVGNTLKEATASGLTEVIERDAAMLAWYSTFEPLGLTVDDERFDSLVRRAAFEDLDVSTVLLTQDVDLPVIATAVHRDGEFPRMAMGSAAGLDAVDTAIDALREAIQNWMELDGMGAERAREQEPRIAQYGTTPGVARSFVDPETTVDASSVSVAPERRSDSLEAIVAAVTASALHPVAAWTTTRDLEALGFYATRVLIPEAQPLFTGDAYFGDRATDVPRSLGFEPRLDRDPHPFP